MVTNKWQELQIWWAMGKHSANVTFNDLRLIYLGIGILCFDRIINCIL